MFDKKEIEAYKSITAPDELRERVFSTAANNIFESKRTIQRKIGAVAAAAAGLIILVGLPVYMLRSSAKPEILLFGDPLTADGIAIIEESAVSAEASARSTPTFSVRLELELKCKTEISVTDGTMTVTDPETCELLYTGTEFTAESDVFTVNWSTDVPDDSTTYYMTLKDGINNSEVIMSYDGYWSISCKD